MRPTSDVSDTIGEFMLKGWVLTDQSCTTAGCRVPLLRSPKGQTPVTHFCANCSPLDNTKNSKSPSTASSLSHISRSSTPPTELSETLSAPFIPPPETEETRRRREQSDRASSEIGTRLLKGWAMLGDECPNENCYGVPLVRPPKTGGENDPRKECVICGSTYVTEADWAGRQKLIVSVPGTQVTQVASTNSNISGNSKAEDSQANIGKLTPENKGNSQPTYMDVNNSFVHTFTTSAQDSVLEESEQSLRTALHVLSVRLGSLTSTQTVIDPNSISSTADAIYKVTQALSQVRQLQEVWKGNNSSA